MKSPPADSRHGPRVQPKKLSILLWKAFLWKGRTLFSASLKSLGLGIALLFLVGCEGSFGTFRSYDSYGPGAGNFDTVVLDPGHGAHDPGARAVSGVREKVLALDTSQRLAKILRSRGFRVIETRSTDTFIPLPRRVAIANATPRSIFVSVHYNYASRRGARGIEVFYHSHKSKRLAANILRESLQAYPTLNRGIKTARFHVLRNNARPAVLLELGFISNTSDNRYAQNPLYRQRLAERVADGIVAERMGRRP